MNVVVVCAAAAAAAAFFSQRREFAISLTIAATRQRGKGQFQVSPQS